MKDVINIYIYLLLHIITSAVITLLCSLKADNRKIFFYLLISLSLPVAGYIIAILLSFIRNSDNKENEIIEKNTKNPVLLFTDKDKSNDEVIPLQDAILFNSEKIKKNHLIKFFEIDNKSKNINILKQAIRDEDVEVAHYASVALTDRQNNINIDIQDKRKMYLEDPGNYENKKKYAEALRNYLHSNLANKYYEGKYEEMLSELLIDMIKTNEDEKLYSEIIDILLKLKRYKESEKYCIDYLKKYEGEDSYIKMLKYYYEVHDSKNFYDTLECLKSSNIVLSSNAVNILRFWNEKVD